MIYGDQRSHNNLHWYQTKLWCGWVAVLRSFVISTSERKFVHSWVLGGNYLKNSKCLAIWISALATLLSKDYIQIFESWSNSWAIEWNILRGSVFATQVSSNLQDVLHSKLEPLSSIVWQKYAQIFSTHDPPPCQTIRPGCSCMIHSRTLILAEPGNLRGNVWENQRCKIQDTMYTHGCFQWPEYEHICWVGKLGYLSGFLLHYLLKCNF